MAFLFACLWTDNSYFTAGKFFLQDIQRVVPSGQDSNILPARVANHSARFGSSCQLTELAI